MAFRLDDTDRKILVELQRDASRSLDEIAQPWAPPRRRSGRASARCARRASSAADRPARRRGLGFEATFFVLIRTSEHEAEWQRRFLAALRARPEVQEAHRLAGDIDYILKVRVRNARAYDSFYQALISEVRIYNVTALLSMEEIKSTVALPL
jgi:Lrp/AsnC family transcriptional regulator